MGHRLSKIYTRTGDHGETGLSDGSRVAKNDPRIEAIGAIDELNSTLGMVLTMPIPADVQQRLLQIQHWLFDLGGELSLPDHQLMTKKHVNLLEQWLDRWNEDLSPLKEFILPGGTEMAATTHLARAVCRRAERRLLSLAEQQNVAPEALHFLNRLSDLLFVCARYLNLRAATNDVCWHSERSKQSKG